MSWQFRIMNVELRMEEILSLQLRIEHLALNIIFTIPTYTQFHAQLK